MKTIFCIVGKSGAGKSKLANELSRRYGLKSISSFTTRAKREGEIEGIEHNFISKIKFFWYFITGQLSAWTKFDANYYGTTKKAVLNNDLYVVDMNGVRSLEKTMKGKVKVFSIYIDADTPTRVDRMKERGDSSEKINRRIENDFHMFYGAKVYCNKTVENYDFEKALQKIYEIIKLNKGLD